MHTHTYTHRCMHTHIHNTNAHACTHMHMHVHAHMIYIYTSIIIHTQLVPAMFTMSIPISLPSPSKHSTDVLLNIAGLLAVNSRFDT